MNTLGTLLRVSLFGESHGPVVGALLDGVPAGLPLEAEDLVPDLRRRAAGAPGTIARVEEDRPRLLSGVHGGVTTGSPLLIVMENTAADPAAYEPLRHTPRPGHADRTRDARYGGHADPRGGGHLSGRLTAGLVAAGAVARKLIAPIEVRAAVIEAGGCRDAEGAAAEAARASDSVGGIVECRASGVPAGLGEPLAGAVESEIARAAFAVPGIQGIEFGAGFAAARMRGSERNDVPVDAAGRTRTNHAGGAAGGITTGEELVWRVAARPPASIARPQQTVDVRTGERVTIAIRGAHDACFALRLPVILEAVTCLVLADLMRVAGRVGPVV